MTDNTFIYLHRKITEWEWYQKTNTFRVFVHCLLKANFREKNWQGMTIKRGQFVTSQYRLADELGLSRTAVKRALEDLKNTNELTYETDYRNTIITVVKYDNYQKADPLTNIKKTELISKEENTCINTHTIRNEEKSVCEDFQKKSNDQQEPELSEKQMQILKDYAKKSNARNIDAYVHSLIKNGAYLEILQEYEKSQSQKGNEISITEKEKKAAAEVEKSAAEFIARFQTKEQATEYLRKNCRNFINPLQKRLMKKWGIKECEVRNG